MLVLGAALGLMVFGVSGGGEARLRAAQNSAPAPPSAQAPATPQPAAPPAQPIFRTGIDFVRVDVIVSDKNGNPVADLKPEDFEVVEQGRPQKIETFKLVSLDGGLIPGSDGPPRDIRTDADEEAEASRDDVRLFAIFLDDYHVRRESSLGARNQIARFVETQLGPSDMIGVMYPLQPTASVRMTRNHEAVVRGLQQFVGVKYDYTPRNEYEQKYAYYPTEVVENIRNSVSMSAIKSLIVHMGGLKEARKALILVSEGFAAMVPPQMRDSNAQLPGLDNPSSGDPNAGIGSLQEDRAAFSAGMNLESDLRDIWDLANKNNTTIYAVDPRGLATNEFGMDQTIGTQTDRQYLNQTIESLRTLAFNTDGRAIVNRNDITLGMKQIVRDTSAYYLLGYNSTQTATDGKFHEIKVSVKRPGVQVRARKGYWAFTAADAARATAPPKPEAPKAVDTALAAISTPSRSRVIRSWIGTERGSDGKTKVTFVWEPIPKSPGAQVRASDVPARVSLTAIAPDGSPYYRGRVPSAPGATPAAAPSRVSFEVPPGRMQLRVAVETADADVIDSELRDISVPDLTVPQTSFGTPAVFLSRTIRELQQLRVDPEAVPTPLREFTRTDRVFVRVRAYGPGTSAPSVTARLLNRSGQAMSELTVTATPGAAGASDVDLSLAPLPPGEYLVEMTATGEGEPVKELVGFRLAS